MDPEVIRESTGRETMVNILYPQISEILFRLPLNQFNSIQFLKPAILDCLHVLGIVLEAMRQTWVSDGQNDWRVWWLYKQEDHEAMILGVNISSARL